MANVGTVTFDVAAETAKLRAELDKVKKDVGGLSATAKNFEKGLKVIGGALAGAFSIGAISAFVTKVNQAGDRLNDLSQRLGVSASSLNVIELAATQAGASTDAVSTAMAKLTENVGSAAMGNKAAAAAISTLGLSTEQLLKLRPDETFEAVTQALSRMPNEFQRAAVAQDLLGKGAKELSAFYREGETAIDAAQAALERHNAVLSDIDVARIGVMNDDLAAQGTIITNLGMKFLSNFTPAVGVAVDMVSDMVTEIGGADQAGRAFGVTLVRVLKAIEVAANLVAVAFETVRTIIASVVTVALTGIEKILAANEALARGLGFQTVAERIAAEREFVSGIAESIKSTALSAATNAQTAMTRVIAATADFIKAGEIFEQKAKALNDRAAAAAARSPGGGQIQTPTGAAQEVFATPGSLAGGAAGNVRVEGPSAFEMETMLQGIYDRMQESTVRAGIGRVEAWRDALSQMVGLEQLAADQSMAIEQAKAGNMGGVMLGLVGTAITASGKLGKVQKALAIAGAIWNTHGAVMKAWNEVPWPANIGAAAAVLAAGIREVQAIRGTNFSPSGSVSGGLGGGFSGGGAAPSGGSFETPGAVAQQQPQRMAQVIIQGDVFASSETVNYLLEKIREAVNDRDVSFIDVNSRQALELGVTS